MSIPESNDPFLHTARAFGLTHADFISATFPGEDGLVVSLLMGLQFGRLAPELSERIINALVEDMAAQYESRPEVVAAIRRAASPEVSEGLAGVFSEVSLSNVLTDVTDKRLN